MFISILFYLILRFVWDFYWQKNALLTKPVPPNSLKYSFYQSMWLSKRIQQSQLCVASLALLSMSWTLIDGSSGSFLKWSFEWFLTNALSFLINQIPLHAEPIGSYILRLWYAILNQHHFQNRQFQQNRRK